MEIYTYRGTKGEGEPLCHALDCMDGDARRTPVEVLEIPCPSSACDEKLILACHFCGRGPLVADRRTLMLQCRNCCNIVRELRCSCHFGIKAPYILKKQQEYHKLQEDADGSKIFAIVAIVVSLATFVWVLSLLR